jgi:hypothetical protein
MSSENHLRVFRLAPLALIAAAFVAGCAGDPPTCLGEGCDEQEEESTDPPLPTPDPPELQNDDPTDDQAQGPTESEDPDNTFEHPSDLDGSSRDPFDILAQREEEGPPEVRTRLHSCQKLNVASLRNIIVSLGVDLELESNPPSAGQLIGGGNNALGASNYGARASEALVWTAAGAAKTFDIFVQAAPEIIANLPNQAQCQVNGSGPPVFDGEGDDLTCNRDALSCMMGVLATDEHVAICNSALKSSTDLEKGKAIAVATVLSAAHSCE